MCANTAVQFLNDIWVPVHTLFVCLHQCILISSFESYFSFQIVPTVYLDSNEQGDNHSMGEGQELQPVNCKVM